MRKKLYIHIGPGKSGTSAIQSFLAKSSDVLGGLGYSYPNIDDIDESSKGIVTGGNSASLAKSFLEPEHPFAIKDEKKKAEIINKFKAVLENSNQNIILSSELFSMLKVGEVEKLKEVIDGYDYEVFCIFYLRRHDQIVESDYAQQVKKHGYTEKVGPDFYNRIIFSYDFEKIIGNFESNFGEKSVIARVYEREQFKNGNLLEDFLYAVQLQKHNALFCFEKNIVNPSPSYSLLEIMRISNSLESKTNISNKLLNLVFSNPDLQKNTGENYIEYAEKINIIQKCEAMYKRVASRYFNRDTLFQATVQPYEIKKLENRDIISAFLRIVD